MIGLLHAIYPMLSSLYTLTSSFISYELYRGDGDVKDESLLLWISLMNAII